MKLPGIIVVLLALILIAPSYAGERAEQTISHSGPWGSGWEPADVAVTDLDGDGNSDIIVLYGFTGIVAVCYGNGEGDFGRAIQIQLDSGILAVAVGHMGPEQTPFLAVLNGETREVSFHQRQTSGAWRRPWRDVEVGEDPVSITVGYRDGAGERPFVAVANRGSHDISLCEWSPKNGFEASPAESLPAVKGPAKPRKVLAADVDDDGKKDDLIVVDIRSYTVSTLLRRDDGRWDRPYKPFEVLDMPTDAVLFDHGAWDEPILAVANSRYPNVTLNVRVDDARFGWTAVDSIGIRGIPLALDAAEVGELRLPILAIASRAGGKIYALLLDPEGGRELVGNFETHDDGLRALAIACLRGRDKPFIIAAGHRLHAFPLFWDPEGGE